MRKIGLAMVMMFALMCVIAPMTAMAQDHGEDQAAASSSDGDTGSRMYLGAALALGLAIAAFGGALGQGRAISAAVESMARQPEAGGRIMGAMIVGLALIETLVIYMLLICFVFSGNI